MSFAEGISLKAGLVVLVLASSNVDAGQPDAAQSLKPATEARVRVSTSKQVYKVGEPIAVTYSIENVGAKAYYVFPTLSLIDGGGAGFRIDIYDERRNAIPTSSVQEAFPLLAKRMPVAEVIRDWILLRPGNFYGSSDTYNHESPRKPGKYRIVGSYWNQVPDWLTEEQRASLKELRYPILTGTHSSESIWIEIRK